jgi:hypothetical protein
MKSFEEICPEWNRKIQEDGGIVVFTITPTPLDITLPDRCIVGEAHGWSQHYSCKKCEDIAIKFDNMYGYHSRMRLLRRTEQLKHIFVKHWNDKHIEKD